MPYSKSPHKYPGEMLELVGLMESGKLKRIPLVCESLTEAHGRRVQIQSFFRAMELEASKMRDLALRLEGKSKVAGDALANARALGDLWEKRAQTVMRWVVRVVDLPPTIIVEERQLSTVFGASLRAFLDNPKGQVGEDTPAETPEEKDWTGFRIEEGMTMADLPPGYAPQDPEEQIRMMKLYVKERNPYDLSGSGG